MTNEERIDDAYKRIDIDTDKILAFYDGECLKCCMKSIWGSTVTMHHIATVALKENAKLRKELTDVLSLLRLGARSGEGISREWCRERLDYYSDRMRKLGIEVE